MPTYDYECEACGHRFEQVQSMRAQPLRKCPQCGKNRLERLVTGGTGFILKGAGFWRNDSKAKKGAGTSSSSTPAAAGEDRGSSGSAEAGNAKPDTKPADEKKPAVETKADSAKPEASKPEPKKTEKKQDERR